MKSFWTSTMTKAALPSPDPLRRDAASLPSVCPSTRSALDSIDIPPRSGEPIEVLAFIAVALPTPSEESLRFLLSREAAESICSSTLSNLFPIWVVDNWIAVLLRSRNNNTVLATIETA